MFIVATICNGAFAQTARISLCALQRNPEKFLNSKIEVKALVFAGLENSFLRAGKCSFRYAAGDDYQDFGSRFPVKNDEEWKLLNELLHTTNCASNVRAAKAKISGTVIRFPATGTIRPDEMPLELVIQSVSDVERVPVKCRPKAGSFHGP